MVLVFPTLKKISTVYLIKFLKMKNKGLEYATMILIQDIFENGKPDIGPGFY